MAAKGSVDPAKVQQVQVDGLVRKSFEVALKIIKHCQEDGSGSDLVTGCLVGVVIGTTLEVTNCFPLPKDFENSQEESEYQVNVLKKLRAINVDYLQVGWYQSTYLGSHISREFLESHVRYQQAIEESVVIIYDPLQTTRGALSLKAYRLTPRILKMIQNNDPFTPESVQQAGILHNEILVEMPVTVRISRLAALVLCELGKESEASPQNMLLGLSASQVLEKNVQLLMENVEGLQLETYRLLGFQKNVAKQAQQKQQFLQRRKEENTRRKQNGESLLPVTDEAIEQELNLKPVVSPPRLDTLLIGEQVDLRCQQISEIAGAAFGKLYLAEGLQPK